MYGFLDFKIDRRPNPWLVRFFVISEVADVIDPVIDAARKKGVEMLVGLFVNDVPSEKKAWLIQQVCNTVQWLPNRMASSSLEMHLVLAHFRLDDARRAQRETRIAALLDPHFKSHPSPFLQAYGEKLKLLAVAMPDEMMNAALHSHVVRLCRGCMDTSPQDYKPLIDFLRDTKATGGIDDPAAIACLQACYFSRELGEREACLTHLYAELKSHKLQKWLPLLKKGIDDLSPMHLESDMADAVHDTLESSIEAPEQSIENLVTDGVARYSERIQARLTAIVESSRDAMEAGVLLDAKSTQTNSEAQIAYKLAMSQAAINFTPDGARTVFKQAHAPEPPLKAGDDLPDMSPIHARSVELLASWIDGLIETPDAPALLARQKILEAQNKTRPTVEVPPKPAPTKQPAATTKPVPTKPISTKPDEVVPADEALSVNDAGLVVQSGLCSTAEFFLGEIQDMSLRAASLKMNKDLLETCTELVPALKDLRTGTMSNERDALRLLTRTESAIKSLRASIDSIAIEARVRQNFSRSLREALAKEPLVYGKRHGGVLSCRVRQADWPWVHREYHQRWLNVQSLEIAGKRAPLERHQALALYVTGSSRSNYAFDVSVHMWIRKEGCHSTPNAGNSTDVWMNTEEWRDAHISCTVLHVMAAD
ncbi:hypothetical protein [Hydrogenophaga sp.]|uniref:SPOR domain-containing protein n=1 Tax=Hydrogenophaga sp. TaxID=1904254 RepID=UPI0025BE33EC|nr:hypothetical protein [Hydrogenophaga sp.]MBT9464674.1 hypothetical protein [Hydrogenophaga sp.]